MKLYLGEGMPVTQELENKDIEETKKETTPVVEVSHHDHERSKFDAILKKIKDAMGGSQTYSLLEEHPKMGDLHKKIEAAHKKLHESKLDQKIKDVISDSYDKILSLHSPTELKKEKRNTVQKFQNKALTNYENLDNDDDDEKDPTDLKRERSRTLLDIQKGDTSQDKDFTEVTKDYDEVIKLAEETYGKKSYFYFVDTKDRTKEPISLESLPPFTVEIMKKVYPPQDFEAVKEFLELEMSKPKFITMSSSKTKLNSSETAWLRKALSFFKSHDLPESLFSQYLEKRHVADYPVVNILKKRNFELLEKLFKKEEISFDALSSTAKDSLKKNPPEPNESKSEFSNEDIHWLKKAIVNFTDIKDFLNYIRPHFNNKLFNQIEDASKRYGELPGIADFLNHYNKHEDHLNKNLDKLRHKNKLDLLSKSAPNYDESKKQLTIEDKSWLKKVISNFDDVQEFTDYINSYFSDDIVAKLNLDTVADIKKYLNTVETEVDLDLEGIAPNKREKEINKQIQDYLKHLHENTSEFQGYSPDESINYKTVGLDEIVKDVDNKKPSIVLKIEKKHLGEKPDSSHYNNSLRDIHKEVQSIKSDLHLLKNSEDYEDIFELSFYEYTLKVIDLLDTYAQEKHSTKDSREVTLKLHGKNVEDRGFEAHKQLSEYSKVNGNISYSPQVKKTIEEAVKDLSKKQITIPVHISMEEDFHDFTFEDELLGTVKKLIEEWEKLKEPKIIKDLNFIKNSLLDLEMDEKKDFTGNTYRDYLKNKKNKYQHQSPIFHKLMDLKRTYKENNRHVAPQPSKEQQAHPLVKNHLAELPEIQHYASAVTRRLSKLGVSDLHADYASSIIKYTEEVMKLILDYTYKTEKEEKEYSKASTFSGKKDYEAKIRNRLEEEHPNISKAQKDMIVNHFLKKDFSPETLGDIYFERKILEILSDDNIGEVIDYDKSTLKAIKAPNVPLIQAWGTYLHEKSIAGYLQQIKTQFEDILSFKGEKSSRIQGDYYWPHENVLEDTESWGKREKEDVDSLRKDIDSALTRKNETTTLMKQNSELYSKLDDLTKTFVEKSKVKAKKELNLRLKQIVEKEKDPKKQENLAKKTQEQYNTSFVLPSDLDAINASSQKKQEKLDELTKKDPQQVDKDKEEAKKRRHLEKTKDETPEEAAMRRFMDKEKEEKKKK